MSDPSRVRDTGPGIDELEAVFRSRQSLAEPRVRPARETAAVFVLFAVRNGEPAVLLTRRSQDVEHHKGEVSFPGGVEEPGDAGLLETARRETVEELGVEAGDIEHWGSLSPLVTTTGFLVHPFTGRLASGASVSPSEDEVDEVFYGPVSALLALTTARDVSVLEKDGPVREPAYVFDGRVVWGATARILSEVARVIEAGARAERI